MKTIKSKFNTKILLGAALCILSAFTLFIGCKHKADGGGIEKPQITIKVIGDAHVNVTKPNFKVPKGSNWAAVLAKAMQCVQYDTGWELQCWHFNDAEGTILNNSYFGTFDMTATIFAESQEAAMKVEGGISMLLSHDKKEIIIEVATHDGSRVTVEGGSPSFIESGSETIITATDTKVVLKGDLSEFSCTNNKIKSINFQGCLNLERVSCVINKLTSINVENCKLLKELVCYDNQLTYINVKGCTNLSSFHCYNNQLTSIDVYGLPLEYFDCGNNYLSELNVQDLLTLKNLSCHDNYLTELNVSDLINLKSLICWRNQLTSINVKGLSALRRLSCPYNQLISVNIEGCDDLDELDLYINKLNEKTFIKILNDLPTRTVMYEGCRLYSEKIGTYEGNCTNFISSQELKEAFENAKTVKKWKMYKINSNGQTVEI